MDADVDFHPPSNRSCHAPGRKLNGTAEVVASPMRFLSRPVFSYLVDLAQSEKFLLDVILRREQIRSGSYFPYTLASSKLSCILSLNLQFTFPVLLPTPTPLLAQWKPGQSILCPCSGIW